MQLQTPAGILLLIAAFTAWRTNLSPFSKGCRERDASMWLPIWAIGKWIEATQFKVLLAWVSEKCVITIAAITLQQVWYTFSAFWLWSSVVSVLISVTTDMSPTGDLLVTFIFLGEVSFRACSEAFMCYTRLAHSLVVAHPLGISCREHIMENELLGSSSLCHKMRKHGPELGMSSSLRKG